MHLGGDDRTLTYDHGQRWCEDYVTWYNASHHYSILGVTPEQVLTDEYIALAEVQKKH
jgi:hypothetical protein